LIKVVVFDFPCLKNQESPSTCRDVVGQTKQLLRMTTYKWCEEWDNYHSARKISQPTCQQQSNGRKCRKSLGSSGTSELKGTVSPDFKDFFMTYNIKSVLTAWALIGFKFFHPVVILIF
jgi:hypothetical protein